MNNTNLSDRIKKTREKKGITMAEAARRLNLSKIGYCRYEYGERTPSIQTLEIIAQCFDTSVDYLLGNSENDAPKQILIKKDDAPYLFEIAKDIDSIDINTQKILYEYYKAICNNN